MSDLPPAVSFDCWNTLLRERDWREARKRRVEGLLHAARGSIVGTSRKQAGVTGRLTQTQQGLEHGQRVPTRLESLHNLTPGRRVDRLVDLPLLGRELAAQRDIGPRG